MCRLCQQSSYGIIRRGSLAKDIIYFNKLPLTTKKYHKFKEMWLLLTSMPQLCKTKITVIFKRDIVEASDSYGNVLITGFLDPMMNFFMIPIVDNAEEQRVKEPTGYVGATSQ